MKRRFWPASQSAGHVRLVSASRAISVKCCLVSVRSAVSLTVVRIGLEGSVSGQKS
jgi:hypothetical protein